jgi:hypothetical protein
MYPDRIRLSGVDYFQYLLDRRIRNNNGPGHIARHAIFLKQRVDDDSISTLTKHPLLIQLLHTRLSRTPLLGYPLLNFQKPNVDQVPVSIHFADNIPTSVINESIDAENGPPFRIHVIHQANSSILFFSFYHVFFDFAGIQSLLFSLSGMWDSPPLVNSTKRVRPFLKSLSGFFREVIFTFREANAKMTVPEHKIPAVHPLTVNYQEYEFTHEELTKINERSVEEGCGLNQSVFFLAAVSFAMHRHIFSKQKKHRFLWVPVPVNMRKKSDTSGILFNHLTFLFYKIRSEVLSNRKELIGSLRMQLNDQTRRDMPQSFIDFVNGYRHMPLAFYYPMLHLPSWGKLSSFSFSVLGETLSSMSLFANCEVADIHHFPSNPVKPGITFLFYRYRGKLRIISSWIEGQYAKEVQSDVMKSVREFLHG